MTNDVSIKKFKRLQNIRLLTIIFPLKTNQQSIRWRGKRKPVKIDQQYCWKKGHVQKNGHSASIFSPSTLQKIMRTPSKNKMKYMNRIIYLYLLILSFIFSFTIYINFFLNVLGCTNAHGHSGIHIVWWTSSTHTERRSSHTRIICKVLI